MVIGFSAKHGFNCYPQPKWSYGYVAICVAFGVLARFMLMARGHNYDFDSYQIVVKAKHDGLTPWQTGRYNYGPLWSYFLRLFDWLNGKIGIGFRFQIVGLLTLADLVIAYFIYRHKGRIYGVLFFINPISIIITGYHNQFDNLAIAIVCGSILLTKKNHIDEINWRDFLFVFLLGISLATKHTLIFFILWIALTPSKTSKKLLYLFGPNLIFGLMFLPYLGSSWDSIKLNVAQYRSFDNAPFWNAIGIVDGNGNRLTTGLFVILICGLGYFLRKTPMEQSFLIHCVMLVILSPSIANQYLAIGAVGAIGLLNTGFILYVFYGTYWLATSSDGLHIVKETQRLGWILYREPGPQVLLQFGYQTFPLLLILGLVITFGKSTAKGKVHAMRRS
jgi:hypothetical protein